MPIQVFVFDTENQIPAYVFLILNQFNVRLTHLDSMRQLNEKSNATQADLILLAMTLNSASSVKDTLEQTSEISEVLLFSQNGLDPMVNIAMQNGASYNFSPPYDEQFIQQSLLDILEQLKLEHQRPKRKPDAPLDRFGLLYGNSMAMQTMYRKMRRVADTELNVLFTGESGCGKELAARTIHQLSSRREQAFLAINCSALAKELLESELFGHKKGAFTGASSDHIGVFERANEGTLFLDEITEMDISLQATLLRVLEDGVFHRLGGEKKRITNVRVIAASNQRPLKAVEEGKLRKDLYFRLAQFPIVVPPLRHRESDILNLASLFLNELNQQYGTAKRLSKSVMEKIASYEWPGNVRELKHAIHHAYILAKITITLQDLPSIMFAAMNHSEGELVIPIGTSLKDTEKQLIIATLAYFNGDKKKTALKLGISVKTLYNKLNRFNVEKPVFQNIY